MKKIIILLLLINVHSAYSQKFLEKAFTGFAFHTDFQYHDIRQSNKDVNELVNLRNAMAYEAGIQSRFYLSKRFFLETGIHFGIQTSHISVHFDTIVFEKYHIEEDIHDFKSIHFLRCPLSLGFQFNIGDKYSLSPYINISYGFILSDSVSQFFKFQHEFLFGPENIYFSRLYEDNRWTTQSFGAGLLFDYKTNDNLISFSLHFPIVNNFVQYFYTYNNAQFTLYNFKSYCEIGIRYLFNADNIFKPKIK